VSKKPKAEESDGDDSSSSSSEEDSDSSEEESEVEEKAAVKSEKKPKAQLNKGAAPPPAKQNGQSKPKPDNVVVTKKRKTLESGTSVPTAVGVTEENGQNEQNGANGKAGKKPRKMGTPFQRIKAEEITFADNRLKDNTFAARGAGSNDYGERASRDLIVTRGDGFRKEKNKKKRGSYRGGEITMQSHSIKFDY